MAMPRAIGGRTPAPSPRRGRARRISRSLCHLRGWAITIGSCHEPARKITPASPMLAGDCRAEPEIRNPKSETIQREGNFQNRKSRAGKFLRKLRASWAIAAQGSKWGSWSPHEILLCKLWLLWTREEISLFATRPTGGHQFIDLGEPRWFRRRIFDR